MFCFFSPVGRCGSKKTAAEIEISQLPRVPSNGGITENTKRPYYGNDVIVLVGL